MSQSSYTLRSDPPPPLESDSKWGKTTLCSVISRIRPRDVASALISWGAYLMFDSYSFEAETARRSFSCLTRYPVKSGDQVSLVFPSHRKDPGSITATLLRGESLRTFPKNTSALNKTCFVAHRALLRNVQQSLTTAVTGTSSLQCSLGMRHMKKAGLLCSLPGCSFPYLWVL